MPAMVLDRVDTPVNKTKPFQSLHFNARAGEAENTHTCMHSQMPDVQNCGKIKQGRGVGS